MISQKEIAKLTGLSPSLVSRVLSGKAAEIGIAQETVDKVMSIANKQGYIPSKFATGLKKGKTHLVGVIVQSFEDVYLVKILEILKREASRQGLSILLTGFENGQYSEEELVLLQSYQPEATIVIGSADFYKWPQNFVEKLPNLICIGQSTGHPKVKYFSTDEAAGAELVAQNLKQHGHSKVMLICDSSESHQRRLKTTQEVFKKHQLKVNLYQEKNEHGFEAGRVVVKQLMDQLEGYDAVYALDDYMALGVVQALQESGLRIPDAIGVCGFDDIPFSKMLTPALSTVRQPIEKLVTAALAGLIQESTSVTVFPPEWMERRSL